MNRRAFLAAMAMALSIGQAASGLAAEPGISATEVTLGMWTPLTGPTAIMGVSERDAIDIAIDEINAAGGINGRKLKLVVYDDAELSAGGADVGQAANRPGSRLRADRGVDERRARYR